MIGFYRRSSLITARSGHDDMLFLAERRIDHVYMERKSVLTKRDNRVAILR